MLVSQMAEWWVGLWGNSLAFELGNMLVGSKDRKMGACQAEKLV